MDRPVISGKTFPVPPGHHRLVLIRQAAARVTEGGEHTIVLPRSILLTPPGGAWRRVAAGGGADLSMVAFSKSVLDPELLGDAADGLLGMLGVALGADAAEPPIRVVRLPPDEFDEARAGEDPMTVQ